MTKQKLEPTTPDQQPPADALPSKEPAPVAERECIRCHKGNNDFLGPLTKDRFGWWMHESCRAVTEREAAPWR
jgi:hypothetical protein